MCTLLLSPEVSSEKCNKLRAMLRGCDVADDYYRHSIPHIQAMACSKFPPVKNKDQTERITCPKPLPSLPPPPKDDTMFWGAMTLVALAGGFIFYAKQNPEVRDWITIYAPWLDDFIAIAYQENLTYKEFAIQCINDIKKYFNDSQDQKPKQCSLDETPATPIITVPEELKDKKPGSNDQDAIEESPCDTLTPLVIDDICEIDKCIKDVGDAAINNYLTARDACAYYNKLVEDVMADFSINSLKKLHEAVAERSELVRVSIENAKAALVRMDEVSCYLERGSGASKEAIDNTKALMQEYREKIETVHIEWKRQNDRSLVIDKQWLMVEQMMDKYIEENETMFQGLKYNQKKPAVQGDLDLFLHHTLRYIAQVKETLYESKSGMSDRINRGLATLPQDVNSVKARNSAIQAALAKRRAEMERDYKKRADGPLNSKQLPSPADICDARLANAVTKYKADDQKIMNDKILKESLKKQLERHQETMQLKIEQKEREALMDLNELVNEKVEAEKEVFAKQLKEMASTLKVVEDKLNGNWHADYELINQLQYKDLVKIAQAPSAQGCYIPHTRIYSMSRCLSARLKAEQETHRSQELWSAGAALLAATKKGGRYIKVANELKAIEKASGDGDKLVLTVLKSIPKSVREQGLVPESVLRERYHTMERTALKVALVEQDGAPLPIYWFSWLQSVLLFMKISGIPQSEYEKPPREPSKDLDTFDLLQRARFWIERGNIPVALRYVDALKGASRAAASTWYDAARAHVEVRQAAEAILAHAASLGLQYV